MGSVRKGRRGRWGGGGLGGNLESWLDCWRGFVHAAIAAEVVGAAFVACSCRTAAVGPFAVGRSAIVEALGLLGLEHGITTLEQVGAEEAAVDRFKASNS